GIWNGLRCGGKYADGEHGTRGHHLVVVCRGYGKIGTDSAFYVVAGRDGGAHSGIGVDTRGNDGDSGYLHGRAFQYFIYAIAGDDGDYGGRGTGNGFVSGLYSDYANRY